MEKCEEKNCVQHLPVAHHSGCILSGRNKCQDIMHNKTCWTKEDLATLRKALNNYFPENDKSC